MEQPPLPVRELALALGLLTLGIFLFCLSFLHFHGHITGADGAVRPAAVLATCAKYAALELRILSGAGPRLLCAWHAHCAARWADIVWLHRTCRILVH